MSEDRFKLFLDMVCERRHQPQVAAGKFQLDMNIKVFIVTVIKHWRRLPRKSVGSTFLK